MFLLTQEDVDQLKAAAAVAADSSLTVQQKQEFFVKTACGTFSERTEQLRKSRQEKKESAKDFFNWISYLKPKELAMMGGYDLEVATSLHRSSTLDHKREKKSKDRRYKFLSFENCLESEKYERQQMGGKVDDDQYELSYYAEANFVDKKFKKKKKKKEKGTSTSKTRCTGDSKVFKRILAEAESYDMEMSKIMMDRMTRKKTEMAGERRREQRNLPWSFIGLLILIEAGLIRALNR